MTPLTCHVYRGAAGYVIVVQGTGGRYRVAGLRLRAALALAGSRSQACRVYWHA